MMKIYYRILGIIMGALVLAFTAVFLILPDSTYSKAEKRNLQTLPHPTLSSLSDGSFMEDVGTYAADQFPFRTFFMQTKTGLLKLIGKNESQGVYSMKDGSLCERFTDPGEEKTKELTDSISAFLSRHPDSSAYFMLVPNAVSVYPENLPRFSATDDQNLYIDRITEALSDTPNLTSVDVREAFLEKKHDTRIFYRTDHHWTTEGALIGAGCLWNEMGISAPEGFSPSVVSNTFSGSLVSKSGFQPASSDTVTVYLQDPDFAPLYTVTYEIEAVKTVTPYDAGALKGDNPYEVFFSGNHPLITIDTTAGTGRSLLVIKDSYANALIPFLIPCFDRITVLDPRYYYDDIDILVAQNRYSDLLFLYNVNTLSSDTVLKTVLDNHQ